MQILHTMIGIITFMIFCEYKGKISTENTDVIEANKADMKIIIFFVITLLKWALKYKIVALIKVL